MQIKGLGAKDEIIFNPTHPVSGKPMESVAITLHGKSHSDAWRKFNTFGFKMRDLVGSDDQDAQRAVMVDALACVVKDVSVELEEGLLAGSAHEQLKQLADSTASEFIVLELMDKMNETSFFFDSPKKKK